MNQPRLSILVPRDVRCWATLLVATATLFAASRQVAAASAGDGSNIARGQPYTLSPTPTYTHCTDPDDRTQLTDGKTTTEYFWTQRGTVGWTHAKYVTITVDLGRLEPIGGVSLTTAAGVAGVTWPMAIQVLVSDDGNTFRSVGDLVALDLKVRGPWPEGYAIRRLVTSELGARGRYVQFVIIPLAGGPYIFTDEVEVYRGPAELLEGKPVGTVTSARELYERGRLRRAVEYRFRSDVTALEGAIANAPGLGKSVRQQLLGRLKQAGAQFSSESIVPEASFRAVLPLTPDHRELFKLQADLWRSMGRPALRTSVPCAWDPIDPFEPPPAKQDGDIEVHVMRGEYRAVAINLFNSTSDLLSAQICFNDLPGAPAPRYVTLHEVEWTDTSQGIPVGAALPEASRVENAWKVTVLPGLVRQVWLTFHVEDVDPGDDSGHIVVRCDQDVSLRLPLRLKIWPLEFPEQTTMWLGGWSYTNSGGAYGITRENREPFLAHLQSHFVNAPWANSAVLRSFEFVDGDPNRIRLDTRAFDDWIRQWPNAGRYMVFLSVAHYGGTVKSDFGGAQIGSPEFDRRVGTWISAWVDYLGTKGIAPSQLGLLIHDEPHEGSEIGPFLAWARAIQAAEPEVLIWEDPTYRNPEAAPRELFDACDVLCPNRPMWLERSRIFQRFYAAEKRRGRELQFYSCSGPAKLLDPYSYYRLQTWHAWHVGATGSFFWAFGDNSGSSSWNEYFAKAGPNTPLFLDDRSVTAGKHMEAIRESVEDYQYLVMLQAAVERAKHAGHPAAAEAAKLLETVTGRVLSAEGADGLRWHDPKDRTLADRVRVEILDAIVSLQ